LAEFERLRQLLLGQEQERLDSIEAKQGNLPQRLPEALEEAARRRGNERMAKAIAAPVAIALGHAVRDNPQTLVDALFPIIGPAIRRAIAEALRDFSEGFNNALESSFTPKGLGWRIEAWRSGLSYAQVVLNHTLKFRIDHLFLIDRQSGIVLHRESAPDLHDLDADAIAGMLTAIGDFVRDSVGKGGGSLASATVGENLLWVIDGPRFNLAAFLRGVPPAHLRTLLELKLESLHADFADPARDLQAGTAEAGAAFAAGLQLPALEHAAAEPPPAERKPPRRWPYALIGTLLAAAVAGWWWRGYEWRNKVDVVLERFAHEPGYVLTQVESQRWRSLVIHGLRDPDAAPPEHFLTDLPIDAKLVHLDLRAVISPDAAVTKARVRRLLQPPDSVELAMDIDGTLHLRGAAVQSWIDNANSHAAWIAGVNALDTSALRAGVEAPTQARAQLQALRKTIESLRVDFDHDTQPVDPAMVDGMAAQLKQAVDLAVAARWPLRIEVYGEADASGNDDLNRTLRRARASWLGEALQQRGIPTQAVADASSTLARRSAGVHLLLEEDHSTP
jgi:outer membrane protein OmpA-like peptidoglycan-associated protein